MLVTPKLVAPERVTRGVVWVFVVLMGAAVVAALALQGDARLPGTSVAAQGVVETSVVHAATMFVHAVEAAWRETLHQLTKVVIALLDWHWWPLDVTLDWQLRGGVDVLHS